MENPKIRFKGYTKDWEQRKLGELGTVQTCKRIFKDQTSEKGDIPFFKNGTIGLEPDSYISREMYEEFRRLYPYPEVGDTLISVVGSIGRTAEYTGKDEYFQDSNVVWLKTDGSINKKFLKISYQVIKWLIEGSTVKHLYNDNILRSEIIMPVSQIEQAKIAEFFEELDHLITLHQRKCEQTKKLKKYMLQKMFPQNGAKVPEIRFDGFTYDWEQRKLSELLEKYEDPVETPHDGYERVGIRSHAKGTFHSFVEPGKELDTAKMYRVAADKFILNITFAWEHAVAITDNNDAGKLVSHRFPQFSFNPKLKPHFFKYLMLDKKFREHLELSSPGGAGRNRVLKISDMLKYEIKLPSIEEQIKIGEYFDSLDHLITLHQRQTDFYKKPNFYFISS